MTSTRPAEPVIQMPELTSLVVEQPDASSTVVKLLGADAEVIAERVVTRLSTSCSYENAVEYAKMELACLGGGLVDLGLFSAIRVRHVQKRLAHVIGDQVAKELRKRGYEVNCDKRSGIPTRMGELDLSVRFRTSNGGSRGARHAATHAALEIDGVAFNGFTTKSRMAAWVLGKRINHGTRNVTAREIAAELHSRYESAVRSQRKRHQRQQRERSHESAIQQANMDAPMDVCFRDDYEGQVNALVSGLSLEEAAKLAEFVRNELGRSGSRSVCPKCGKPTRHSYGHTYCTDSEGCDFERGYGF